jgi:hypothetical protein
MHFGSAEVVPKDRPRKIGIVPRNSCALPQRNPRRRGGPEFSIQIAR